MRCSVYRDVMVKCSEPIVVAHSGLAAKQCVGTRGHPAKVTDKTALVFGTVGVGGLSWNRVSGVCVEVNERPGHTLWQSDHLQTNKI